MSTISPQERAESEIRTNRRTTAVFAGVIAVIACATYWFSGIRTNQERAHGNQQAESQLADSLPESRDLQANLHAMKRELHVEQPDELWKAMFESIDNLEKQVAVQTVSHRTVNQDDVASQIQRLQRRAAKLLSPDVRLAPLSVNIETLDFEVEHTVAEMRKIGQVESQRAIKESIAKVRDARAAEIREARLAVGDAEDKIENLRVRIAAAERQQREIHEKAARAAALQREMADVRAYLSPFIHAGHVQPNGMTNAYHIEHTVKAMPVSLQRLERLGALEPTMKGLAELYKFGGMHHVRVNDRPRGAFPKYGWEGDIKKSQIRSPVERAQELLRQHGQALVEARLLSP